MNTAYTKEAQSSALQRLGWAWSLEMASSLNRLWHPGPCAWGDGTLLPPFSSGGQGTLKPLCLLVEVEVL